MSGLLQICYPFVVNSSMQLKLLSILYSVFSIFNGCLPEPSEKVVGHPVH